jgi:HSP20 family protein
MSLSTPGFFMAIPVRDQVSEAVRRFERSQRRQPHVHGSDDEWEDLADRDTFLPLADIEETDEAYLIDIDLPGVRKKDIHVEANNGRLVITGERVERERAGLLRRRTRSYGRFHFEIRLPEPVDEDKIEASFDDGELRVVVPKRQAASRRHIKVT